MHSSVFMLISAIVIAEIVLSMADSILIRNPRRPQFVPCVPASNADLQCTGTGLVYMIPSSCMNDGGISAVGDSLEVYCIDSITRFCLSGEACPWRNGTPNEVDSGKTCSRAGLRSAYMANAWCNQWNNHHHYKCCSDGSIGFQ